MKAQSINVSSNGVGLGVGTLWHLVDVRRGVPPTAVLTACNKGTPRALHAAATASVTPSELHGASEPQSCAGNSAPCNGVPAGAFPEHRLDRKGPRCSEPR